MCLCLSLSISISATKDFVKKLNKKTQVTVNLEFLSISLQKIHMAVSFKVPITQFFLFNGKYIYP